MPDYPLIYIVTEIIKGTYYAYIGILDSINNVEHKIDNCMLLISPTVGKLDSLPEETKNFVLTAAESLVFNDTYIKTNTIKAVRFLETSNKELIEYVEKETSKIIDQKIS